MKKNDIKWYLKYRNNKYINRKTFINTNKNYINEWLSGFIEAEGCFSIRKNKSLSFSIGQNNDDYLINIIKIINTFSKYDKKLYF